MTLPWQAAPLYMANPSTEPIRAQMRADRLGCITTPAQGNRLEEGWWWCADNGIFGGAYRGDEEFLAWLRSLRHLAAWCLFAVAPDVVGNAYASISRSYDMLHRIRDLGFPVALVGQDHMEAASFWDWDDFDCFFIGGSTEWKLSPAAANLARVARSIGKHVHMGRVNSGIRYEYARTVADVHTVDGTTLTRGPDKNLPKVLSWRENALNDDSAPLFDELDVFDGRYDLAAWLKAPAVAEPPLIVEPVDQLDLFTLDPAPEVHQQLTFA
ncbi:hypothetical protein [Nonomuraea glycinis]|uniref:hypothetical protein n=1 Tax=Nonomuraea glycinis TaxID=2047744 RepID=UPI0033A1037F